MLVSMTGFGRAEMQLGSKKLIAEIRSLNSKQLDLSIRIPSIYRGIEMDIRSIIAQQLVRGKVDFQLSFEETAESATTPINRDIFEGYLLQIKEIARQFEIDITNESLVQTILRLPDVLRVNGKDVVGEDELNSVKKLCSNAVESLVNFRRQEGSVLYNDIKNRVLLILDLLQKVEPYEKQRIEDVKKRLREALKTLEDDVKINSDRFEQEVIYYLEKLDITEEKVRLKNHCKYFLETAGLDEQVGRKLGFIAQEMGREINTMGSKANHSDIQKVVVQMKDELEKIKEQSLNIL
ncbi:MAG: YicC family protein [Bacteroidales bacterium]|nr:YicC family protein [Bacteroidales bacterium]HOA10052.1 YicC family protein [Tenuifilaceae bacterium]MBP8642581.1 YicC family protein [Bacteroidales bacterium]NLI86825.1 YicC family protein [Bacteroidales bacterium]HOC35765.1 YicC family protein [Tenuifilaceae bacterium]